MWETPSLSQLQDAIATPSHPVGMRMRAAYYLRQVYDKLQKEEEEEKEDCIQQQQQEKQQQQQDTIIQTLGKGLQDVRHGSLLRHELAYVMGQLRDDRCCVFLENVLLDTEEHSMVRHECAEAIGAIGSENSIPVLEQAIEENSDVVEISQTCEIAVELMRWRLKGDTDKEEEEPMACACMLSPYSSADPAPPHPSHVNLSTATVGSILRNVSLPLFQRYRAMFSLRNRGGQDAVLELGNALTTDDSSALLRHEIAYVLGQMQHPASIQSLAQSLRRNKEHEMVRHEAAEALGAIEGNWEECEGILKDFLKDEDVVVRESCMVALDAADYYWGHTTTTAAAALEEKKADSEELTFGQRKAVTNGRSEKDNDALLNHFNVKV